MPVAISKAFMLDDTKKFFSGYQQCQQSSLVSSEDTSNHDFNEYVFYEPGNPWKNSYIYMYTKILNFIEQHSPRCAVI